MMKNPGRLGATRPAPRGLASLAPRASRRPMTVSAVMGGYQYRARAEKLRSRGVDVIEFGQRVLQEGSFGEDVLQLQNWLAEEAYYVPMDGGYTGYFGAVTKEALQAWQRDAGLPTSGRFDAASRWAYLRAVEARVNNSVAFAQASGSIAVPTAAAAPAAASAPAVPLLAAAVLLAAATAAKSFSPQLRYVKSVILAKLDALVAQRAAAAQAAAAAEEAALLAEIYEEEAAAAAAEVAASVAPPTSRRSRLRRLSDDELQRYIAPFKRNAKDATPAGPPRPLRPSPVRGDTRRSLKLSPEEGQVGQGALTSRHGTYYGGRQVIERVRQYLREEGGPMGASGGSQRMQNIGYDMMQRGGGGSPAKPSGGSFEDVPAQEDARDVENGAPQALLSGTDLEDVPVSPLRPVPVQRPAPARGAAVAPVPASAVRRAAPRPVPVVKGGERAAAAAATAAAPASPADPNAAVIVADRPVKLIKPARLAGSAPDYSSMDD